MKMGKMKWLAIIVAVGLLVSIVGATAVFAHDPTETRDGSIAPWEAWGQGMWGMMNGGGHMGYYDDVVEPGTDDAWEPGEYCFGYQDDAESWGMHGHHNGMAGHITLEEMAEVLELTSEELLAKINEGQTIEQIALDQGISIEQVIEAALAPHAEMIAVLVEDGYLSQEQADEILEQARLRIEQLVATQWFGYGNGYCAPGSTAVEPESSYDSTPERGFGQRGCW
ncbi:hypothetical protein ACFLYB_05980 [Chloroflexota bacterium]